MTNLAVDEDLNKLAAGEIKLLTDVGMESVGNSLSNLSFLIATYKVPAQAIRELDAFGPKQTTIDSVAKKIATIDGLITESGEKGTVAAAFKSGQLQVTHTFPKGMKADVNIQVNLDGVKLAKGLAGVTFSSKKFATTASGGTG